VWGKIPSSDRRACYENDEQEWKKHGYDRGMMEELETTDQRASEWKGNGGG
jgi:hypothetical protein